MSASYCWRQGGPTGPLISIPLGMGKLHQHQMYDWGYETEPESNLNNRCLEALRGKVVGGCSSINVMAYTRGNRGDYDRWARQGAIGWSYASVLPYFRKCETWEGGANEYRDGSGPLGSQYARTKDPIFSAWKDAGVQAGYPVVEDYNAEEQEGFGTGQYTIRNGRRSSSARAYLRPARRRAIWMCFRRRTSQESSSKTIARSALRSFTAARPPPFVQGEK